MAYQLTFECLQNTIKIVGGKDTEFLFFTFFN